MSNEQLFLELAKLFADYDDNATSKIFAEFAKIESIAKEAEKIMGGRNEN